MNKTKYLPLLIAVGFVASLALTLTASAQGMPTSTPNGWGGGRYGMHGGPGPAMMPGVAGTVSAISGTTLTVNAKTRPNATSTATTTVYTIDASNAKVMKNGTSSTVSSIATGDMIFVQGTVTGTNVTATVINDGMFKMMGKGGMPGFGRKGFGHNSTSTTSTPPTSPIQGNGEPIVGGSITAISGSTLTITNTSNVTYVIDASNAKIIKNGTSTTISNVATGDNVIVQGTVNGASVVASSVIDQGANTGGNATSTHSIGVKLGFFGAIGNFFKHLFGF